MDVIFTGSVPNKGERVIKAKAGRFVYSQRCQRSSSKKGKHHFQWTFS